MAYIRRHRQREPELGYAADALTRAADTGVRRISGPAAPLAVLFGHLGPAARGQGREVPMSSGTTKQRALEVIEKLPADATLEDAIERLILLAKVERGLAELDAGQGIDHSEAKRRLLR
jgi:hypothetical protein